MSNTPNNPKTGKQTPDLKKASGGGAILPDQDLSGDGSVFKAVPVPKSDKLDETTLKATVGGGNLVPDQDLSGDGGTYTAKISGTPGTGTDVKGKF